MKKSKKAFSLIEVMVASIILSITVFGVFKLIGENEKLINNSNNYRTSNSLFMSIKECIKNIKYDGFIDKTIGKEYEINFGNDYNGCEIGNSNEVVINNIEYKLISKITDYEEDKSIDFELKIENDYINLKKEYRLLKQ